ncbi:DUF4266 domain-containing protein [Alteromonas sp. 1_MG-2023]|uniref:DUF4266 domain-containing protein n=1 Tax=Alteromonas sp. 1_MG-2023 TaxID=3062669 RepID=UPI0026E41DDC|nr:DUF4266 domain-containing protein [Alteromonas sp. 1_MG-2023]MDO6565563.1 DUF4266 domain-containing protein [Alteromonas sp. 1_MG-2023]
MKKRMLLSAVLLTSVVTATGCVSTMDELTNIEPWVKPYERSNLADPIMSVNRNPVAMAYMRHVFEAREAARGADGGAGGGCGCN